MLEQAWGVARDPTMERAAGVQAPEARGGSQAALGVSDSGLLYHLGMLLGVLLRLFRGIKE